MYLSQNGNQVPVVFAMNDSGTSDSGVGGNKTWLYIALLIAIIAVIVTAYLIYNQHKKNQKNVGYQLY
jgi:hypothetical protein